MNRPLRVRCCGEFPAGFSIPLFYVFLLSYFEKISLFSIFKAEILVGRAAGDLKFEQNLCAMALSKKAGQ